MIKYKLFQDGCYDANGSRMLGSWGERDWYGLGSQVGVWQRREIFDQTGCGLLCYIRHDIIRQRKFGGIAAFIKEKMEMENEKGRYFRRYDRKSGVSQ